MNGRLSSRGSSCASTPFRPVLGINSQHLASFQLGGDDASVRIKLDCVRLAQGYNDTLRLVAIRVDPPDLIGCHHREVKKPVRTDLKCIGKRQILRKRANHSSTEIEFDEPTVGPVLIDGQAVLMNDDPVGGREIIPQNAGCGPLLCGH